jgi:DNA repair exonuclease SbcCD ATPase subunit
MNIEQLIELVSDTKEFESRLKQLKEAEERLKDKLAVANTVEKAQSLVKEAQEQLEENLSAAEKQQQAYLSRMADLEKQFTAKAALLDEKWTKLSIERELHRKVREETAAKEATALQLKTEAEAALAKATSRLETAKEQERIAAVRLAKIQNAIKGIE